MSKRTWTKCMLALIATAGLACASASAGDWGHWRGPNYNGSTDEAELPTQFSRTDGVKWSAPMPGPSAGTPIVVGDSVLVSSTDPSKQQLVAICLDRTTGKVKWSHDVSSGYQAGGAGDKLHLDERSNYASPSPVSDGKVAIFVYGNGDFIAFDMDGKQLWYKNLQKEYGDFAYQWTFSASPTIYEGRLYLPILQRNEPAQGGRGKQGAESFLLALDPMTGKELFRAVRPTDAVKESRESYGSVIPFEGAGRKELIIGGGDILTGHDPATGAELWRWGTYNPSHREVWWRVVPSPVVADGVVVINAPKKAPTYAVRTGAKGDVSSSGLAWKSADGSVITSDVPTPLFYQGKLFVQSDIKKSISAVEPATGKILWTTPLTGTDMFWSSPTGGGGHIYTMNVRGHVVVLDPATGKILLRTPMAAEDENDMRSSIAAAGGNLFIRTNKALICVGK